MDTKVLIKMLERRCGRSIACAADCEYLSLDFRARLRQTIGVNTLKRLLGFLPYNHRHRASTLNLVAQYLGFQSWDDLERSAANGVSVFDKIESLVPEQLEAGAEVELTYRPDRTLRLRYEDGGLFRVVGSENSKLRVGDILEIRQLAIGFPLMATDVVRSGESLGQYTGALMGGLTSLTLKGNG